MRRLSLKRKQNHDKSLPLTPLIDMVFLVMIFFIINTSFSLTPVLDIKLPKASSSKPDLTEKEISIYVRATGSIVIDDEEYNTESLLQALVDKEKEIKIYIYSDEFTSYGKVLNILDVLRSNDFVNVFLVTDKKIGNE
ncbi:ExbD/TolR family protein [Spirochaeta cellobiosiphila]|uniref:ExbD/TolR family protein n=1 Tax=Spirochaeta cellobiosiphila TaxID=504483 RepID=UPI00041CABEF|nr:biopolymer transporter ExbD [Spirochaeta cellobiosiphila]